MSSYLKALPERLVGLGPGARLPLERVVVTALARPGIEDVDDAGQLRPELRDRPEEHPLQRRDLRRAAVRRPGSMTLPSGPLSVTHRTPRWP